MRLARGAPRQIRDGADTLLAMKDVRYGSARAGNDAKRLTWTSTAHGS